MICRKCGNVISESSKFCSMCGTPVSKERFCATCGQKLSPDARFCTNCGTEQHASSAGTISTASVVVKTKQSNFQESTPKVTIKGGQSGKLLRKMSAVTKFNGEPTVGVANQLGALSIYDNRVEFVRKAGLTLVGTAMASTKSDVETYYYSDCTSITNGTYMVAYVTLVLNLRNGQKVSFCPAIPVSRDMETVANLILHYI